MADLRLGSLNYVALIGRAVQEPDLRYTPKGNPVLRFSIAVNRRFKDPETGEWKDDQSFFNVVAFKQVAERNAELMKKGSALLIEGSLRSRSWTTPNGDKRRQIEIIARRVQVLDKIVAEPEPAMPAEELAEEVDIPKDELDDIPF